METEQEKTLLEIQKQCLIELEEVLKKHNCVLEVDFSKQSVLNTTVLQYQLAVVYKGG